MSCIELVTQVTSLKNTLKTFEQSLTSKTVVSWCYKKAWWQNHNTLVNCRVKFVLGLIVLWNFSTSIFELHSILSESWLIFSHSKIKFRFYYAVILFINLLVVTSVLPIMTKLNAILKSECSNILEFLVFLQKGFRWIMILPQRNISSEIFHLVLTVLPH